MVVAMISLAGVAGALPFSFPVPSPVPNTLHPIVYGSSFSMQASTRGPCSLITGTLSGVPLIAPGDSNLLTTSLLSVCVIYFGILQGRVRQVHCFDGSEAVEQVGQGLRPCPEGDERRWLGFSALIKSKFHASRSVEGSRAGGFRV